MLDRHRIKPVNWNTEGGGGSMTTVIKRFLKKDARQLVTGQPV